MNSEAFLILFIAFIALMGGIPILLRKIGIPPVISLLIVGMGLGPNCLDLVHVLAGWLSVFGGESTKIASDFTSLINALGQLGLVFLMALAGMEADFKLIRSARKPVITLSILTFLIPAISGYLVYAYFRADDFPGKLLYASLFASHSVGIVFPVIRELKLSQTRFGAAVLISTVITDISSIILLAVSVQIKKQTLLASGNTTTALPKSLSIFDYVDPQIFGAWFTPFFLFVVLAYLALAVWLVYLIGKKLLQHFSPGEDMLIIILLFVILGTVLAGEFLGVNLVVGSFIAGLALSRLVKAEGKHRYLIHKFENIGYGLLIPFLFVTIGMQTNFRAFSHSGNLQVIVLTVLGLVISKLISGYTAMRISGFGNTQSFCAGLMTVPQLSATLAAAAIGKSLGILDENFFNAIIVLSIVTTLPVPTLVRKIIERAQLKFTQNQYRKYNVPTVVKQDDLL